MAKFGRFAVDNRGNILTQRFERFIELYPEHAETLTINEFRRSLLKLGLGACYETKNSIEPKFDVVMEAGVRSPVYSVVTKRNEFRRESKENVTEDLKNFIIYSNSGKLKGSNFMEYIRLSNIYYYKKDADCEEDRFDYSKYPMNATMNIIGPAGLPEEVSLYSYFADVIIALKKKFKIPKSYKFEWGFHRGDIVTKGSISVRIGSDVVARKASSSVQNTLLTINVFSYEKDIDAMKTYEMCKFIEEALSSKIDWTGL